MPVRSCVACRKRRETRELMLFVALPDGKIWISGSTPRPNGRGASCCKSETCVKKLEDQPARLCRALRQSGLRTSNLLDMAHAQHDLG